MNEYNNPKDVTEDQFYNYMQQCLDLQREVDEVADKHRKAWKLEEGLPVLNRDNHTAALVEIAEAIDHVGYKWWKKDECFHSLPPERATLFLGELVDVFHFFLSELNSFMDFNVKHWNTTSLRDTDELFKYASMARTVVERVNNPLLPGLYRSQQGYIHDLTLLQEAIIDDRLRGGIVIGRYIKIRDMFVKFFDIAVSAFSGLSPNDPKTDHKHTYGQAFQLIFKHYIGKNALNRLRQELGYGTKYQKVWNDGREDNLWLEDILSEIEMEDISVKMVHARLYDTYMGVNYV